MNDKLSAAARVQIGKNGPYRVSGNLPLDEQIIGADGAGESVEWQHGRTFPLQQQYALCRCGHSAHKPFCDGTHAKVGFDGTETASRAPYRDQAKVIRGPTMTLTDVESLCASGRFCDPNGSVWNLVNDAGPRGSRAFRAADMQLPVGTPGGLGQCHRRKAGTQVRAVDQPGAGPGQGMLGTAVAARRRAAGRGRWIRLTKYATG